MASSESPSPWCCWDPALGPSSARGSSAWRYTPQLRPKPAAGAAQSSRAGVHWCQSDYEYSASGTPCEWACSNWIHHFRHLHSPAQQPCWYPSQFWLPLHPADPQLPARWALTQGQNWVDPAVAHYLLVAYELGAVEFLGIQGLLGLEWQGGHVLAPLQGGLPHSGFPSVEGALTGCRCLW